MKNQERERITRERFDEITVKSWTWARLTEREREKCKENLLSAWWPYFGNNESQVIKEYEVRYSAFLDGCGYENSGWREPEPEAVPAF